MKSQVYFIPARGNEADSSVARKTEKLYLQTGVNENIGKDSFAALKIHFGEERNTGYIKPEWIERVVGRVKSKTSRAFFTDTNTLYVGKRSNSIEHLRLASEHGFSLENTRLPIIIADGLLGKEGEEVEVSLTRVKSAKIASVILHSDILICLSHFTGHMVTGFGAAIKNLGMGCASRAGKLEQHSDVHPRIRRKACTNCGICLDYCSAGAIIQEEECVRILDERCIGCGECLVVCKEGAVKMSWDEDSVRTQEKMAEYAWGVWNHFKGKIALLNFLIKVTKDCDCLAEDQRPILEDIGILSSVDPLALDKASVDLVIERAGKDVFRKGYDIDWTVQLNHGAQIGLGSLDYELIELSS